jgi:hypothetical protein
MTELINFESGGVNYFFKRLCFLNITYYGVKDILFLFVLRLIIREENQHNFNDQTANLSLFMDS